MNVYLIRHAHAGDRGDGPGDIHRPLSDKGHRRAAELAAMLSGASITRILSSPAARCSQTVQPLADTVGVEVEEHPALWEGAPVDEVLALLDGCDHGNVVVCSHGDIIPGLVDRVAADGAAISGRGCQKGSVWVLERSAGSWLSARYLDRKVTALSA
jgi:phosphohistidine phosphatase SixA